MSLCSLVVHLSGDDKSSQRLRFAADLARARGARITGLFARIAEPLRVGLATDGAPVDYIAAEAMSRAAFAVATDGLDAQFQDLHRFTEADLISQMIDYVRHFDLVVLGQIKTRDGLTPTDLAEQIIIQSGRPVLVLPEVGEFAEIGQRPIFAWADSGTAARGFSDGLMLAAKGSEALIVSLSKPEDKSSLAYRKESLNLAAAHLAAHGLDAKTEQLALSEIGLMDALLNRAADHGADMLALGAFGGGGYPLFSRGSGSRYMLKHMTLPILFSH